MDPPFAGGCEGVSRNCNSPCPCPLALRPSPSAAGPLPEAPRRKHLVCLSGPQKQSCDPSILARFCNDVLHSGPAGLPTQASQLGQHSSPQAEQALGPGSNKPITGRVGGSKSFHSSTTRGQHPRLPNKVELDKHKMQDALGSTGFDACQLMLARQLKPTRIWVCLF